jgi:hypothetical protein
MTAPESSFRLQWSFPQLSIERLIATNSQACGLLWYNSCQVLRYFCEIPNFFLDT